jgi:hypothetical protein
VKAELNIHLEDRVSTKTVRSEIHKSIISSRAAIATELMLRCVNDGVMTIKHVHETTGITRVIWSDGSSFTLFPTSIRKKLLLDKFKEAYNPECLVPTVKHERGSVMVWAAISWYSILLVPLLPFMAILLQGSMWTC